MSGLSTSWADGVGQQVNAAYLNNIAAQVNALNTASASSATSLTLTTAQVYWVFSGSSGTTWTLPAVSGNTGAGLIIENRGSANITLIPAGTDHIWFLAAITSQTIAPGGSLALINDGSFWNALSLDLAHNGVGLLPVANGGTGAATLSSGAVLLGNGTSAPNTVAPGTSGNVLTSNGSAWASAAPSGGSTATGITSVVSTSGTTATLVTSLTIPANTLVAGQSFRFEIWGSQISSASTSTINVRQGTTGTTSDNASASNAYSIASNGIHVIHGILTIRTIGSSGTCVSSMQSNTGTAVTPSPTTITGSINTTVTSIISLWYTVTAGTFQAKQAIIAPM